MTGNKIEDIIREINKDAWSNSAWCYVKLQTLLGIVVEKFFAVKGIRCIEIGLKAKLKKIAEIKHYDLSVFYEINEKANVLKHDASKTVPYDSVFLKKYADAYNALVSGLLSRSTLYMIDSDIFDEKTKTVDLRSIEQAASTKPQMPISVHEGIINTGTSKQDAGFQIHCIEGENELGGYEKSIYATIYNFLQRSNVAEKNRFIVEYEKSQGHEVIYSKVYRYQMMLLTLLRTNCAVEGKLKLDAPVNEQTNIRIACKNINHYAENLAALSRKAAPVLTVDFGQKGIGFSFEKSSKENCCFVTNQTMRVNNTRDIWFSSNLLFSVDCEHDEKQAQVLSEFLMDFFGYSTFRKGQLEAISKMLSADNRSICIMPTGAGKSIVYYMNALLSACPTIVISPTRVLAEDQQRNLTTMHNIDDCRVFSTGGDNTFGLTNRMVFLTPEDLQRRDVILNVIEYNTKGHIANVVLDEIHTLCNWSHDFRPDYLMLCHNLFTFVDRCRYLGFTATANYKVLSDLTKQFKIANKDVVQPVVFDAGNFDFEYVKCKDEKQQIQELLRIIRTFVDFREQPDDRMIVFTHNATESNNLQDALAELENYDTSCFDAEHTYSYQEFISEKKHVLIADSEMGIGINLPNIVHAVHYGLPNSKAQYAQEIGRANRTLNSGKSTVIFVGEEFLSDEESRLISFETSIDEVINIIRLVDSDLSRVCQSIIGATENYSVSASQIASIYNNLKEVTNFDVIDFRKDNENSKNNIQKYLYKLHLIGVIDNWYLCGEEDENVSIQIEVDLSKNDIDYIKSKTIEYLGTMGKYSKFTYAISKLETVEEIIYSFEEWFYDEFLRYHREQLLNVVEFFNYYADSEGKEKIKRELQNYFTTTLKTIDSKKAYIDEISQEELIANRVTISPDINATAQELLSKEYNRKYDLVCYLYNVQKGSKDSTSRLLRIIDNSSEVERRNLLEYVYIYYQTMENQDKIELICKLLEYYDERKTIDSIYRRIPFDEVYYGYLASRANMAFYGR